MGWWLVKSESEEAAKASFMEDVKSITYSIIIKTKKFLLTVSCECPRGKQKKTDKNFVLNSMSSSLPH